MENLDPKLFDLANKKETENEQINSASLSYFQDVRLRFMKNKAAVISFFIFIIFLIVAFTAPYTGTYHNDYYSTSKCQAQFDETGSVDEGCELDPNLIGSRNMLEYAKLPPKIPGLSSIGIADGVVQGVDLYKEAGVPEGTYFLFGTDLMGRDVFVRTMVGALVSIGFGLLAAIIDLLIGVTLGGISGYYGGRVDLILQRIIEVIGSVPRLIWVVILATMVGAGIIPLLVALVVSGWIPMYRIVRSQMMKLKEQEYVLSSKTLGGSSMWIIRKHLIPNATGIIIIWLMFSIPEAIFFESFMSFLGLGISAPTPSLGTLANEGRESIINNPYLLFIPAFTLSGIMLIFNLIADGLRDALDPKMRGGE